MLHDKFCIGIKMLAIKFMSVAAKFFFKMALGQWAIGPMAMQSLAHARMHAGAAQAMSRGAKSKQYHAVIYCQASLVCCADKIISCMRFLLAEQCSRKACCQALLLFTPLCWPCIQYIQQELQICSCHSFELFRHLSLQKAMRLRIQERLCLS